MTLASLSRARRLLCALQDHLRAEFLRARQRSAASLARVAATTAADTIYQVDKITEDAILAWFEAHWPAAWPVQVVMEGIEDDCPVTFPRNTPIARTQWKCILDPIDGTRGIMYDKRSAWSLAALAPQHGPRTGLGDLVVAAMTELPTSKQWRAEQFSVVRGQKLIASYVDVRAARPHARRFSPHPSRAHDFKHGFASIAKFFPDGKAWLGELEETLWAELHRDEPPGATLVFDDQYISTGGQLYELIVGHDRFVADLRPLVFAHLGRMSSLTCHPYDLCTALLLEAAGGVIEAPMGGPVRAPLDTTSPVAWVGYANASLARRARPVLRRLLRERLRA
jgi:fructose-1,6-bisphosphatase/inositol monophosphatase family enzyme